ncbi:MAG TPA: hypothetical protein VEU51_09810 [Candidatus Acidoferrales bacterium]|nr:hypothetical protein [Candidatus Acidoferrales bacterium]
MKRPKGIVRVRMMVRGRVIRDVAGRNLFVNAGRPALAALLGGDTTGEFGAAIGIGSGLAAPTITDTALTAPAYYKALDGHSEDGNGSVTFNWSITSADTGAQGITIQELALFANHANAGLPGTIAPTPMLARKTIAPIVFGPNMSISGTWTLTF